MDEEPTKNILNRETKCIKRQSQGEFSARSFVDVVSCHGRNEEEQ